ncbi:hypothetical protein ACF8EA_23760 [Pseudomonas sp. YQ_5]|uniref:hypothetical protein n=1 Tax=unclassified Pseudomonas TaxID=196821 RepID=UPI0024481C23|nr:hypothetical protein [Pseudomonas sp. GD03696]MDH1933104.1 hypothetical protein [Pseudomonas sp. GD03696]HDS0930925.1 hypothetical protein [Pseudomonas putida]
MFNYMFITDSPDVAEYVEICGVTRIFVDLERNGKVARQGHLNTVISCHNPANIELISRRLKTADLMVRLNPLYSGSRDEVEMVIASGCDSIMVPMFDEASVIETFAEFANGRVKIIPLVETIGAARVVEQVSLLESVNEVHIGLNDLHLQMKKRFMFELLVDGTVEGIMDKSRKPTGFGGVARIGSGAIPAELVMAEHVRLKSSGVILSRAFHNNATNVEDLNKSIDFECELQKLKDAREHLLGASVDDLMIMHNKLREKVFEVVANG